MQNKPTGYQPARSAAPAAVRALVRRCCHRALILSPGQAGA